jgi:hypothetical protein
MTVRAALVNAASPGTTGTQDFTHPELGDLPGGGGQGFVIAFCSTSATDETEQSGFSVSRGFSDGTNDRCAQWNARTASVGSQTRSRCSDDLIMVMSSTGSVLGRASFDSWISNGARIDWTNATSAAHVFLLIVTGTDMETFVGDETGNATEDSSVTITGLADEPDDVFFLSSNDIPFDDTTQTTGCGSFGVAHNGASVEQAAIAHGATHGVTPEEPLTWMSEQRVAKILRSNSASDSEAELEVTAFTSDGFTVTTRNDSEAIEFAYLAVTWGDSDVETALELRAIPTSTGEETLSSPGFKPQLALFCGSAITTPTGLDDVRTGANAGNNSLGAYTRSRTGDEAAGMAGGTVRNNSNPTSTNSYHSTSRPFVLRNHTGSGSDSIAADAVSMESTGPRLDWTSVLGQTKTCLLWTLKEVEVAVTAPLATYEVDPLPADAFLPAPAELGVYELDDLQPVPVAPVGAPLGIYEIDDLEPVPDTPVAAPLGLYEAVGFEPDDVLTTVGAPLGLYELEDLSPIPSAPVAALLAAYEATGLNALPISPPTAPLGLYELADLAPFPVVPLQAVLGVYEATGLQASPAAPVQAPLGLYELADLAPLPAVPVPAGLGLYELIELPAVISVGDDVQVIAPLAIYEALGLGALPIAPPEAGLGVYEADGLQALPAAPVTAPFGLYELLELPSSIFTGANAIIAAPLGLYELVGLGSGPAVPPTAGLGLYQIEGFEPLILLPISAPLRLYEVASLAPLPETPISAPLGLYELLQLPSSVLVPVSAPLGLYETQGLGAVPFTPVEAPLALYELVDLPTVIDDGVGDPAIVAAPLGLYELLPLIPTVVAGTGPWQIMSNIANSRFHTFVEVPQSLPTLYDNAEEFPDAVTCDPWAEFQVEFESSEASCISTATARRSWKGGRCVARIHVPLAEGKSRLLGYARAVQLAFRNLDVGDMRFLVPSIGPTFREDRERGTDWVVEVSCPFRMHFTLVGASHGPAAVQPASWLDLQEAIEEKFQADVAVPEGLTAIYENDPTKEPVDVDATHFRVFVVQGDTTLSEKGSRESYATPGVVVIWIRGPLYQGDGELKRLADVAQLALEGTSYKGVRFSSPFLTRAGRVGKSWQLALSCPFVSYEVTS